VPIVNDALRLAVLASEFLLRRGGAVGTGAKYSGLGPFLGLIVGEGEKPDVIAARFI